MIKYAIKYVKPDGTERVSRNTFTTKKQADRAVRIFNKIWHNRVKHSVAIVISQEDKIWEHKKN